MSTSVHRCPHVSTGVHTCPQVSTSVRDKVGKVSKLVADAPPPFAEWYEYCRSKGFGGVARRSYDGYEAANWRDTEGKPIRNWKQKLTMVWFRDKNRDSKPAAAVTQGADVDPVEAERLATLRRHGKLTRPIEEIAATGPRDNIEAEHLDKYNWELENAAKKRESTGAPQQSNKTTAQNAQEAAGDEEEGWGDTKVGQKASEEIDGPTLF